MCDPYYFACCYFVKTCLNTTQGGGVCEYTQLTAGRVLHVYSQPKWNKTLC